MGNHADAPPIALVDDGRMEDTSVITATPTATVQALYAAFGAGDTPGMLKLIAPDVDWSVDIGAAGAERVPMLRNGRGHDAVRYYFGGVADLRFDVFAPVDFLEGDDRVMVVIDVDVTHVGTGKRAVFQEVHRFHVRDGRIVSYRPYPDTAALIEIFTP
jgi:ketosteroid isomerase-like protein